MPVDVKPVELRLAAFGGRDDLISAQMLTEAALGKENLVYRRDAASPGQSAARAIEFELVRRRFDDSLGMLARLFPSREHRSIGAIARRYGDFNQRLGEWWAGQARPDAAVAELRAAVGHYRDALDVFGRITENTSLERRFAYLGLGKAQSLLGAHALALDAFRNAHVLALQERCAASLEAPSPAWVDDLLGRLALAAEHAGDPAAAGYRRQADAGVAAAVCAPTAPAPAAPSESRR